VPLDNFAKLVYREYKVGDCFAILSLCSAGQKASLPGSISFLASGTHSEDRNFHLERGK